MVREDASELARDEREALAREEREARARQELAQLTEHPAGGWSFRLLQTSLPTLVVDGLTLTLLDAKFRMVRTADHRIEHAAATIEATLGSERLRLQLVPGDPQEAFGHVLVLDDLSDGAAPGLPPQFTAHLSLRRR